MVGQAAMGNVSSQMPASSDSAAQTGYAIGSALGAGAIFFLWLFISIGILLIGLMLKKDAKEIGPTGPLATKI